MNLSIMTDPAEASVFASCNVTFGFTGKALEKQQAHHGRTKQVHGVNVVEIKKQEGRSLVEADGVFTTTPAQSIAVITADCLPVLFCDDRSKMVMAVHAGWRGLTAGILTQAVRVYEQHGIEAKHLRVLMGPCISAEVYEVGPEVVYALKFGGIALKDAQRTQCIRAGRGDRSYVDLAMAGACSLTTLGVEDRHIEIYRSCTFSQPDVWFSYRRAKAYEGNNFSWICLNLG